MSGHSRETVTPTQRAAYQLLHICRRIIVIMLTVSRTGCGYLAVRLQKSCENRNFAQSTPLPPRAPVLCAYPHRNIFRNFMKGASYA
jgi:hypothetical protein